MPTKLARAATVALIVTMLGGLAGCGTPETPRTAALGDRGVIPAVAAPVVPPLVPRVEGLCETLPADQLARLAGVPATDATSTDGSSCTYTLAGGGAVMTAYATEGYTVSARSANGGHATTIRHRNAYVAQFSGAYTGVLVGVALGAADEVALRVYVDAPLPTDPTAGSGDQAGVAARVAAAIVSALGG